MVTAFEGFIREVYPIKADGASFQIKLNCLYSLAYTGHRTTDAATFKCFRLSGEGAVADFRHSSDSGCSSQPNRESRMYIHSCKSTLHHQALTLARNVRIPFSFRAPLSGPFKKKRNLLREQGGNPPTQNRIGYFGNIFVEPAIHS